MIIALLLQLTDLSSLWQRTSVDGSTEWICRRSHSSGWTEICLEVASLRAKDDCWKGVSTLRGEAELKSVKIPIFPVL